MEVISTCPIEYAKQCSERLCYLMNKAGEELSVPFRSDASVSIEWYGEELNLEEICN